MLEVVWFWLESEGKAESVCVPDSGNKDSSGSFNLRRERWHLGYESNMCKQPEKH